MDEEKIKVIFCVGYKQPHKRLNLRKYFRQFEHLNFNIHQNELSVNCHQYAYLIDKNDLKLAKLVKDICYQDFAYSSHTFRKASISTVFMNMEEDIFYYPYDDRGVVIFKK